MHTGLKRRELRKLAGSPDASHRTHPERPVLTGLTPREGCKMPAHRTLTTGRTGLRPVPIVRCLTLAGPGSLHTGRSDTASGASEPASGECFLSEKHSRDFSKNSHRRNRKYALHFLEKRPDPSSLYLSNSTSFSKCANTTTCVPTSARVLAFSQTFSLKELS